MDSNKLLPFTSQRKSQCEASHMEISFLQMHMNQKVCENKTKGSALELASRQKATRKSPTELQHMDECGNVIRSCESQEKFC